MHQASVGFHCPECTKTAAQKVHTAASLLRPQQPYVTILLIAISAMVFLLDQVITVDIQFIDGVASVGALSWDGQLYGPNVAAGDWWRPITVGFVHGNLMHVGFNMVLLYMLGQLLEPALGRVRFLVLYLMSLLGGSVLILILTPDDRTVGASGAVFGLMGAAFVGMRSRGINPFATGIGPLLVLNLMTTFVVPNISIGGHIGGLVAGAVGGWLLFELESYVEGGKLAATAFCVTASMGLYLACLVIPPTAQPGEILPLAL